MEEWRPIPDFDGYEVSSHGRIRSWRKAGRGSGYTTEPRTLKQKTDRYGYFVVNLSRAGAQYTRTVHRLVYTAFRGPTEPNLVVRHLDGDQRNNFLENLEAGTHKENTADAVKHGAHIKGERVASSKLTQEQVREIRRLWESGDYTQLEISQRFGVRKSCIGKIVRREAWAHID